MQDEEKTKDQLINELRRRIDDLEAFEAERKANEKTKDQLIDEQRQRISELEAFEAERKAIATELKGTRQRLQYLLAVSPAIIYSTKASGDYACTFVTEKSSRNYGLYAGGDDDGSQGLARPSPS